MKKEEIMPIILESIAKNKFIKAIFSSSKKNYEWEKISARLISQKEATLIQLEKFKENKSYHFNIEISDLEVELIAILDNFNQILLKTEGEDIQFISKNGIFKMKKIINNEKFELKSHNKDKDYFFKENEAVDFLVKLGIMNAEGKVLKNSYNKFKQINKYIEFISKTIEEMQSKSLISKSIKILDFGCGKSYLTFSVYSYLSTLKDMDFEIIGLDLKKDVIKSCSQIAKELSYDKISFLTGDIKDFNALKNVDLVISLHACDNATDYSIIKALELGAKGILAVPCCHHEFNTKMSKNKNSEFFKKTKAIASQGILLEKYASIATDALRANILELCGFKTKVMEFIDAENTPKNILIKAIKNNKHENLEIKLEEYKNLKEFLGIEAMIETELEAYMLIK